MKNSVFNEELKAQQNRYFSADFSHDTIYPRL